MAEIVIKDFDKNMELALKRIALNFQEALKDKLSKDHGKDTGLLQSKINAEVVDDGIVISMPFYAEYLEYGTPGRISAPEGLAPNPNRKYPLEYTGIKNGKKQFKLIMEGWAKRHGFNTEEEQFLLARHIALYGTRPYPFIRTTFINDLLPIVKKALADSFK